MKGRKLYLDVLEDTKLKGFTKLNQLATLNLSHEELLNDKSSKEHILNLIDKLKFSGEYTDLEILKDKVVKLIKG